MLEGSLLDAAPDLLGDLQGFFSGEAGQNSLVLIPAEAGGIASFFLVQLADDPTCLADRVLTEQVAVGVVYLIEVAPRLGPRRTIKCGLSSARITSSLSMLAITVSTDSSIRRWYAAMLE